MWPLLEMDLYLDENRPFAAYSKVIKEFHCLWGISLRIFCDDLSAYAHLPKLLAYLSTFNFGTVSFFTGMGGGDWDFDNLDVSLLKKWKAHALAVPICYALLRDTRYTSFIAKASLSGLILEVLLCVDLSNLSDIDEIVAYCLQNGVRRLILKAEKFPANPFLKISRENYRQLVRRVTDINHTMRVDAFSISVADCPYIVTLGDKSQKHILGGCSAGITSCAVDRMGQVVPCLALPNVVVGNTNTDSLARIWQDSAVFQALRDRHNLKGACSKCDYLISCGGCRAESYYSHNDLFGEDPVCWLVNENGGTCQSISTSSPGT